MKQGINISLIQSLDNKKVRKFRKYLKSPFFHNQEALIRLLNIITKIPEKKRKKKNSEINIDKLFSQLYPETSGTAKQRKKKVENTLSDLALAAEQFIALLGWEADLAQHKQYLAAQLIANEEPRLVKRGLQKYKKKISLLPAGVDQYLHHYKWSRLQFEAITTDRLEKEQASQSLRKMFEFFEKAYFLVKLHFYCEKVFRAKLLEEPTDPKKINAFLKMVEPHANAQHPAIHLFYLLIQLGSMEGEMALLKQTHSYLKVYRPTLALEEQNVILRYLINYCTDNAAMGKLEFLMEKLLLESWGIDTGILISKTGLQENLFINTALSGLAIPGKLSFCEDFISKYAPLLPKQKQQEALALVRAYIAFHKKDYLEADKQLDMVKSRTYFYALRYQSLQLRLAYERFRNDTDLDSLIETSLGSFQRFFSRDTYGMSDRRRPSYRRLAWFVQKMVEYHNLSPNKEPAEFRQLLQNELHVNPPAVMGWVSQKIAQLPI